MTEIEANMHSTNSPLTTPNLFANCRKIVIDLWLMRVLFVSRTVFPKVFSNTDTRTYSAG